MKTGQGQMTAFDATSESASGYCESAAHLETANVVVAFHSVFRRLVRIRRRIVRMAGSGTSETNRQLPTPMTSTSPTL